MFLTGRLGNSLKRRDAMNVSLLLAPRLIAPVALIAGIVLPFSAAMADTVKLVATLNGANEVPPADPTGTGTFSVEIDPDKGDFCYTLTSTKIAAPTMAHVHTGAAGVNGAPVVTLDPKGSDECIAVEPNALKPIIAKPEDYYVNIHNAKYPGGAIRGQLMKK
jgi:hypothetical protein